MNSGSSLMSFSFNLLSPFTRPVLLESLSLNFVGSLDESCTSHQLYDVELSGLAA